VITGDLLILVKIKIYTYFLHLDDSYRRGHLYKEVTVLNLVYREDPSCNNNDDPDYG